MAEAEELVSDAARHATVFAQKMWRRHRKARGETATVQLTDVAPRLDLLIKTVFGSGITLRPAQLPARATMLSILFRNHRLPRLTQQIPATNGSTIWLPPNLGITESTLAIQHYKVMALQQAARLQRGSATACTAALTPLQADAYLLLEAEAADCDLAVMLPGMAPLINHLRQFALAARPDIGQFPKQRRPLENFLRQMLGTPCGSGCADMSISQTPVDSLTRAQALVQRLYPAPSSALDRQVGPCPLLKDWWTGSLIPRSSGSSSAVTDVDTSDEDVEPGAAAVRAARLARRPEVRQAKQDEDDEEENPGSWMVQIDEPHQHAEDPMGLQRPTDRDEQTSAEQFGDMVSELPEARLVSTPGRPKEVLLTDDPPDICSKRELKAAIAEGRGAHYPEWDYRKQAYREPGATVRLLSALNGSAEWVEETLKTHRSMLNNIRRQFEMLRAHRVVKRKQIDGDDIDLDAYIDSIANLRAGGDMAEGLYQSRRSSDRSIAITLLIDVSGSTDSWLSTNRRVIDVEREALLLVCIALEGMGEPYSVMAFSGEGPHAVTVRPIKGFDESYSHDVALRISSLQPEHYTRAGAAIRHATAGLMHQRAAHRLLLLLSDGKPSDQDEYEGRYGVEDMRQSVIEANLQGISPFCLTIDRQAGQYLPRIFGPHQYALLAKPEQLPTVLLDWMKRLIAS